MRNINYETLAEFVNMEDLYFSNDKIRIKDKDLDEMNLSRVDGLTKANLETLEDILHLKDRVLKYPMGSGQEMMLFHLIMQSKRLMTELGNYSEIKAKRNLDGNLATSITILERERNLNNHYTITISTDRTITTNVDIEEFMPDSLIAFRYINPRFRELANIHL